MTARELALIPWFLLIPPCGTMAGVKSTEFMVGADLSVLKAVEDSGVRYREDGKEKDGLAIFRDNGFNYVRLRLFVDPDGSLGQVNSLPYTLALARRVKDLGLGFLLNFHYSDKWADPGNQHKPAKWRELPFEELAARVRDYTRGTLDEFKRNKCAPDIVQIGNEITPGMLWEDGRNNSDEGWDRFATLVKAGIAGAREALGKNVPLMIHTDAGSDQGRCKWFFDNLRERDVESDLIGVSYYRFWHGPLQGLKENLAFLTSTYGQDVIVVETAYEWDGQDQGKLEYPLTPDGQAAFLQELMRTVRQIPRVTGVFYWAPEWTRGEKWCRCTWSRSVERRALFDYSGNALPGLKLLGAASDQPR